jgi:hypothetical protein
MTPGWPGKARAAIAASPSRLRRLARDDGRAPRPRPRISRGGRMALLMAGERAALGVSDLRHSDQPDHPGHSSLVTEARRGSNGSKR